jgi:hypothetical protein
MVEHKAFEKILDLANRLNPKMSEAESQSVLDLLKSATLEEGEPREIERVLESELSKSYLDHNHLQETVTHKNAFSYALSDLTSKILGIIFGTYSFAEAKSIVSSHYTEDDVDHAVNKLNSNGYYVLPEVLGESHCTEIIQALGKINFYKKKSGRPIMGYSSVNIDSLDGNAAWAGDLQDILAIPVVQKLVSDKFLLLVAQKFLNAIPIHCQANSWWSKNYSQDINDLNKNAQMFHQDKEYVKFVKIFIYLNDVGIDNGPHQYVRGSSINYADNVPDGYKVSDRLSDQFLQEKYAKEDFVNMTGKSGSIIIEDTSGFHKGVPVLEGHRLLAQIEYTSSLYFNGVAPFTLNGLTDQYVNFAKNHARMFLNYDNPKFKESRQAMKKQRRQYRVRNGVRSVVLSIVPKAIVKVIKKL